MVLIPSGKAFTQLRTTQRSPKRFYKYENAKVTEGNTYTMLRTRTIFNDVDQLVKLYNHFSFQGNVLRKLIIFGNVMQHLVPRSDFPLDVERGICHRAKQRHLVVQTTSTVFSSQKMTNQSLQVFLSQTFLDD